jgi:hypothetical protein
MTVTFAPASDATASNATERSLIAVEWERIEVLARCALRTREAQPLEPGLLVRLAELQARIEGARASGHAVWQRLTGVTLSTFECDVLACVVGAEARPELAVLYQHLQSGSSQPYPTAAVLHELLALDDDGADMLHDALDEAATLRQEGLVEIDGAGPFQPIRPGPGVTSRVLGRRGGGPTPPGSTRVLGRAPWEDLVLPPDRLEMMRELLLWVRHRDLVQGEWGGVDCGGPLALFSGPSGTGKTMAAAILATELGWPLYRVDLGRLVSKYIGETEKNLNRLFGAAHGRPMVLQFDEADSLFSKRGEVRDARDRYANMEVSHLLARIEQHRGPCVLTTNLRRNLDPAFARRFQVVIDFPRPDPAARAELWARLLPPGAPRAPELDLASVASAVALTGGEIRNAALHSAYLAAGQHRPIGTDHVALAIWRELGKSGREHSPVDLGPLAAFLPEAVLPC